MLTNEIKMYNDITRKIGCRPEEYKTVEKDYECDNLNSRLSNLSVEELRFLIANNFFRNRKATVKSK